MSAHTSNRDNGGPAFPDGSMNDWGNASNGGMSLRDWYAGMAIQGMLASGIRLDIDGAVLAGASVAFAIADAMIAERAKQ